MQRSWIFLLIVLSAGSVLVAGLDRALPPQTASGRQIAAAQSSGSLDKPESITAASLNPLDALSNLISGSSGSKEFLPPDEAFKFSVAPQDANTLVAHWLIADGYYLYRDKMRFSLKGAQGIALGAILLPQGKVEQDESFGRVQIYPQDTEIRLPLTRTKNGSNTITLNTQYQGCAEAGICYPPITKQVKLELPAGRLLNGNSAATSPGDKVSFRTRIGAPFGSPPGLQSYQSQQDRIAERLASGSIWLNILAFFSAGVLLAFTPCVLPMIPILSGVIAGQGSRINMHKTFLLSFTFVLAMALTYSTAGVIVGLSGQNVQAFFQNPWIIVVFASVFVLLAASMFGFYDLQMPTSVQTRLAELSGRQRGGTFIGAGVMGFLTALIVGPCVTAPLVGALLYIAHTGNGVLGGVALLALALGMGTPLLVIGTAAGKLIPKAGAWMETTKAVFGVLLLGVGIWLLARILPSAIVMVLWALLLIVSGIYMGAFDAIHRGASNWLHLCKGLGLAISIYGALLLVGAAGGAHDILQPLKGVLVADNRTRSSDLQFQQIKGLTGLQRAAALAITQGKPIMLDFYADWCVSCKEMQEYTFSDKAVQRELRDTMLLQADVTVNDAQDRALLKSLGLFGPPAILFYTPDGRERRAWRVVGYMPADQFSRHIKQALRIGSPL